MPNTITKFAFFGSSSFSVIILQELFEAGFIPAIIVTTPDKPKGRKLALTPTPVKLWAQKNNIKVYDPQKLNPEFTETLRTEGCDLFILASYGKIIPETIVNMPINKTLNVHPSLLPKYRGASPLQSAILGDTKETGITIMITDAGMDHGPIIAQKKITMNEWPPYQEFEDMMAHESGKLLVQILPRWINHEIVPEEQNHDIATFTKKITKEDGLINIDENKNKQTPDQTNNERSNFLKIQAFNVWPVAYFFLEHGGKNIRVKITQASFDGQNQKLIIEKVIPEGGKEMKWEDFKRGYYNQ